MDKDTFRRFGHEFVDWIADYMTSGVEKFPVISRARPGEIRSRIPESPPLRGEPMERIFSDFREIILPGITHWQHPGWFAYFPANNSPASVLAEILTAGMGVQAMIWQTSPAAAELEEAVMGWLARMLGLPREMAGVIQDTASTATLCALLCAREKLTNFESNQTGLKTPLRVYASDQTHSSIEKGVKIAGFGRENLRLVPTDATFAMIPEKLEEAINDDRKHGFRPACAVATVGTTSSSAIDPLRTIGEVCRRQGLWLHVDAAYAGTAAILPEQQWMLDGVELADSFVFNPHKWMFTNFDCSAYFVREPADLIRTFEVHPEYLKTGLDSQVKNYRDWGIQLGRRFRALKLWFVLRSYGVEGLQSLIREHLRLARLFKGWVEEDHRFELLAPVPLSLVCFRFNDGRSEAALNVFNRKLMEGTNADGKVYLTHTVLRGKFTLRLVVGQRSTEERHVRAAWDLVLKTAEDLLKQDPTVP